jgi:hypothetical protein
LFIYLSIYLLIFIFNAPRFFVSSSRISRSMPLLSFELGKLALVRVTFKNVEVGSWNMQYQVDMLPERVNNWKGDTFLDMWQCFWEIIFVVTWCILVFIEVLELRRSIELTTYSFSYFLDMGNVLDWANYFLQLYALFAWAKYVAATDALKIALHYNVYEDYLATARLLRATDEMGEFQELLANLKDLISLRETYSSSMCVSLLLTTVQTLKNLDFHPKLGIITKTIRVAASDLLFFMVLFLIVQVIYAILAVLIFGSFSDMFNTFPTAITTNLLMLLGVTDPQEPMEMSSKPFIASIYYWSYMSVTFFILLNALLAIIVDSYAHVKANATEEDRLDPLAHWFRSKVRQLVMPKAAIVIPPEVLFKALHDIYENAKAEKDAFKPNAIVRVVSEADAVVGKETTSSHSSEVATLLHENLDSTWQVRLGDSKEEFSLPGSRIISPRVNQVRLPVELADAIMFSDAATMQTTTLFHLISSGAKPVLVDQLALVLVLKTLAPTMHMKIALALSINVLTYYGLNADLNGDGVVSPLEWEALQRVLDGIDASHYSQPTCAANKSRLIHLMML